MRDLEPSTRKRSELKLFMAEHIGWIRASATSFDAGEHSESKRIASAIRTLVHDSDSSTSLLTQLGIRESMTWYSTIDMNGEVETGLWVFDDHRPGYEPVATNPEFACEFSTWWSKPLYSLESARLNREYFVLSLANRDGGAHVDPSPPALYRDVKLGSLNPRRINTAGERYPDEIGPIPAALRTMAAEILRSLDAAKW